MFGRKSGKRKLDKFGVGKEQRKSQTMLMDELNKKLIRADDNIGPREESANKMLEKSSDRLERAIRSMRNTIRRGKRGVKRVWKGDDIKKHAKDIFKEYYKDYKDLTLDNLKKLEEICKEYEVILSDRLNREMYRRMFEAIRISSKERKLTPERLKMVSQKIFKDLKQTGEAADGTINSVMHPFIAFMQLLLKIGLFLQPLIEKMSDDYSLFQIRNAKKEMESTVFKKFSIIDLTQLSKEQYRAECKEKLAQFNNEISSLVDSINENKGKLGNSDSDARFGDLLRVCVNL